MPGSQVGRQGWRRFAGEVATIVLGILLAVAANAGYKYLGDRSAEREILAALRDEFEADVRELGADQRSRAGKLACVDLVAAVRSGEVEAPPPDSLARTLLNLLGYRFYTASHPVLDDLLVTGRLELIRSKDLRKALMKFGQERSRIGVVEQREREFVASQFEPWLAGRLDLWALASDSPSEVAAVVRAIDGVLAEEGFGSLLHLDRERTNSTLEFGDHFLATVYAVQRILGEAD